MILKNDTEVSAFLEHHGVKGMKWGIRKDRNTASGSDEEAILAIYGGVLAISLVSTTIIRGIDSGRFHSIVTRGKAFVQRKKGMPWKVKPELSKKNMSVNELSDKVVSHINSSNSGLGSKANCRRCTFAYEMRRRGFDVAATPSKYALGGTNKQLYKATHPSNKGESYNEFSKASNWGKNKSTPDAIFSDLAKQPKGSRGDLTFGWAMGGAHSVAWENMNGKPVIVDGQTGKIYKKKEEFKTTFHSDHINSLAYTRLDNASLNYDNLTRWLKDA